MANDSTTAPDALREAIERVRRMADPRQMRAILGSEDVLAVCDAAARAADAERERDEARATITEHERHAEKLSAAVCERDATLAGIERLLREGKRIEAEKATVGGGFIYYILDRVFHTNKVWNATLPDAVRAAVAELEK